MDRNAKFYEQGKGSAETGKDQKLGGPANHGRSEIREELISLPSLARCSYITEEKRLWTNSEWSLSLGEKGMPKLESLKDFDGVFARFFLSRFAMFTFSQQMIVTDDS